MPIHAVCPNCRAGQELEAAQAGGLVVCEACQAPFLVAPTGEPAGERPRRRTARPGKSVLSAATVIKRFLPRRLLRSLDLAAVLLLLAAVGFGAVYALLPDEPIEADPEAQPGAQSPPAVPEVDAREQSRQRLSELAQALRRCGVQLGVFPPSVARGPDGQALYSWRVTLLPLLGEEDLYQAFRLDEPWDGPHNRPLLARMPRVYAPVAGATKEPYSTYYQVFVGKGAAFEEGTPLGRGDFPDGLENTLLLAEAAEAVPWTKPDDLSVAADRPLPRLGGLFAQGFHVAFADAKVYFVPRGVDERCLRGLITRNGGEPLRRQDLLAAILKGNQEVLYQGKPAAFWVQQVGQWDAGARQLAAVALNEVGSEAVAVVPVLARELHKTDHPARAVIARTLGHIGPAAQAAVPDLVATLKDSDPSLREAVVKALTRVGRGAVPALAEALRHDDPGVRAAAARVLGEIDPGAPALRQRQERMRAALGLTPAPPGANRPQMKADEAVPLLLEALLNKDPDLRTAAAEMLVRLGPEAKAAVPALLAALRDEDPYVATTAATVLAALGAEARAAIPVLIQLLDSGSLVAIRILTRIGPEAVPALIEVLRRPSGAHAAAAQVLAQFGPRARAAVPDLAAVLAAPNGSGSLRAGVAQTLGAIGPDAAAAVPALLPLLRDPERVVRLRVALALLRIEPRNAEAVAALSASLADPDLRIAVPAAAALARYDAKNAAALGVLRRALSDPRVDGPDQAAEALGQLGPAAKEAFADLCTALRTSWHPQVRRQAAHALARIDPEAAVAPLVEVLKGREAYLVVAAAEALGGLGAKAQQAVPALTGKLADEDVEVRTAVGRALRQIDPPPGSP